MSQPSTKPPSAPRIIAWEITRSCNLSCAHCRASAERGPYPGELSTEQCFDLIEQVAALGRPFDRLRIAPAQRARAVPSGVEGRPLLILTGGEPLLRPDALEIAVRATGRGLRVVMAPNGTLVTPEVARRMREAGIARISISLDFPTAAQHDAFRGVPGAFEAAVRGIEAARQAGVEVQINTTITRRNIGHLGELVDLARRVGAVAFHPFFLVPTGRGAELVDEELAPEEYERALHWLYDKQQEVGDELFFKPTDVPHYWRVRLQRAGKEAPATPGRPGLDVLSRGCLAGTAFCFISHVGKVQPCGYLELEAGDLKRQSFAEVWENSPLFRDLRDPSKLEGKCGECEYRAVCGGCRARAFAATGNYLAEEPYCVHRPRQRGRGM
jgi:radical SAM protein with 4Fe4S-binding SPASM domain